MQILLFFDFSFFASLFVYCLFLLLLFIIITQDTWEGVNNNELYMIRCKQRPERLCQSPVAPFTNMV